MMIVMQPKKVKDVRELQSVVEEWELKVKQLQVEHEIDVDERIKIAILCCQRISRITCFNGQTVRRSSRR